jgi:hypothetical protein
MADRVGSGNHVGFRDGPSGIRMGFVFPTAEKPYGWFEMPLVIRNEQIEAFARSRYRDFEERTAKHLREYFPEMMAAMSAEEIRAFIRACVERASAFGLTSEQAVVCYAHLPLVLGEDYDRQPRWAFVPYVLRQEQYPANDRAKLATVLAYELKAKESRA